MRKLTIFITLLFIMSSGAGANTLQEPVSELIKKIENKFNVFITYDADLTKLKIYNAEALLEKKNVESALDLLVKDSEITYKKLRRDYYVLLKRDTKKKASSIRVKNEQQLFPINGTVLDESNAPMPGATVMVKGTSIATMTDIEGNFSLNTKTETGILVISFLGYKTKETTFKSGETINIKLEFDAFGIDEIVVAGVAGFTPRSKLTITVEKLSSEEINEVAASSSASMLQGKLAGVNVKHAYGTPGSGATIQMRGATSLRGSNPPLIIVDGIMVQTNLADFNIDDIESVEVVKGAAAASLYGSKAGNGVIVISTKRGKNIKDKFQIKIRNEYGISNLAKELDLAAHHPYKLASDNDQFPYTKYEGVPYNELGNVIDDGSSVTRIPTDSLYADQPYSKLRNQQREFFKKGNFYTNFVSLSNKSEKTNLYLSFENNKNTGIIFATDGYNRQNLRLNADVRLNEYITFSTSNIYMNAMSDNPGTSSGFSAVLFMNPDANLLADNQDGSPYKVKPDFWTNSENPLYPLHYRESISKRNSFLSNISANLKITDWVNIQAKYTLEKLNKLNSSYNPKGYLYSGLYENGYASRFQSLENTQNFQFTANLNKLFGNFTVKSKLSYLYESNDWESFSLTAKEFIVSNVPHIDWADQSLSSVSSYEGAIAAINIFGILDIDYQSKYLFSGLIRQDGSSLFGENERWHTYYRVAGAYRISEEFEIPGIQELKLRTAIGTSGQRPYFADQYETMSVNNGIAYRSQLGNNDLKPSQSQELEFALNMQFLQNFILDFSYSETTTKNALLSVPLASHASGFISQVRNAGILFSNAFELSLNSHLVQNKNFSLSLGVNFDRLRQKVVELEINKFYTGPSGSFLIEDGQNFGVIIGNKWLTSLDNMSNQLPEGKTINDYEINSDGYVIRAGTQGSKQEAPIALDADNDGNADKVIIADCNSDFNMNLNINMAYKGLSLYMLWSAKKGGQIYNKTKQYLFFEDRAAEIDQAGKPEGEKKSTRYYQALYNGNTLNSHFVEDGSYIKLREISLAYRLNFKEKALGKYLKTIKISLTGRNLLTFTNYTGYDPEVGTTNASNFSYDNYGYPNFRTITGAIELTF